VEVSDACVALAIEAPIAEFEAPFDPHAASSAAPVALPTVAVAPRRKVRDRSVRSFGLATSRR
jgi:hypothetical protein